MKPDITLPDACRRPRPDSHVLALEEVRLRGLERALILGTALLLGGFLAWAQITRLPEISVALGEVSTAVAASPVQHLEGGIVDEVLVREGDLVVQGQALLRMNDAAARADLGQLGIRNTSLRLQAQRLEALAAGHAMAGGEASALLAPQRAALDSRLVLLADRLSTATEQVAQRRSEIATLGGQAQALERQINLLRDEYATRQGLARTGLTTRISLLEAQRMLLGAQADHERISGQMATAHLALAEAEARMVEIRSSAMDEARQEAARVAQEVAETQEAMARLQDRAERTVVRAPSAGVVRGLNVHRPGSVVQPGALLAEVLPLDATLVVDARITPRDIGFVVPGQAVNVKVQSFDYARFGTVAGTVERISAGAFVDEQRQPHYRARIALAQAHVGPNPSLARLAPGMTVQADITTGEKSIMQYLLKPLYASTARAFQER